MEEVRQKLIQGEFALDQWAWDPDFKEWVRLRTLFEAGNSAAKAEAKHKANAAQGWAKIG